MVNTLKSLFVVTLSVNDFLSMIKVIVTYLATKLKVAGSVSDDLLADFEVRNRL